MNKKGFIDFDWLDFDVNPYYIAFPILGAMIGFFTASGGFSASFTGEQFDPGMFTKIVSAIGGAVIGYIFAWKMSD